MSSFPILCSFDSFFLWVIDLLLLETILIHRFRRWRDKYLQGCSLGMRKESLQALQ